ncbi:hypothetical protein GSR05_29950 (plasmid) [Klebsiella pneumoniae]|nr:hypothetical protein GSR05_29950 [Klebsiella pneumoniae]
MDTSAQSPDLQQVSLAVQPSRALPPKAVRPNRLTLTGHRPSCPDNRWGIIGGGESTAPVIELIPAYTRVPGSVDFGIDSDNNHSPAVVRLYTGPYEGAVLKASQAQLGGDGVVIHMTTMYWNRKNYRVDAYALKDDTLMANVATDVNHHYMSRILLPSIAAGIGKAGDLYADANTEILTNATAR